MIMQSRTPGAARIIRMLEYSGPTHAPHFLFPGEDHAALTANANWLAPHHDVPAMQRLIIAIQLRVAHAGAGPDQVTHVVLTHLHTDHVGWNTVLADGRWMPTFPHSRYIFTKERFSLLERPVRQRRSGRERRLFRRQRAADPRGRPRRNERGRAPRRGPARTGARPRSQARPDHLPAAERRRGGDLRRRRHAPSGADRSPRVEQPLLHLARGGAPEPCELPCPCGATRCPHHADAFRRALLRLYIRRQGECFAFEPVSWQ